MRRARVLVVEDEHITAHDIEATLQGLGHEVPAITDTGEDALDKVEALRPDLVLLDIRLKGALDGVAVADEIRRRHQIPVVYLTANADPETVERATRTEAYGYLLKPFSEQELHTTVQVALYKAEAERELRRRKAELHQAHDELEQRVRERTAELNHLNRQLRLREAYFRSLIENSSDIIAVLDAEGRLRYQSPAMERVLGYGPEDSLDQSALGLVHPEDVPAAQRAFTRDAAGPEPFRATLRVRHRDGSTRAMEITGRDCLRDPCVRGIIVNARDVTEREEWEQALIRAKEAAEQASRAKSEFLGTMSHELRTPLNSVIGFTNVLRRNKDGNLREQDLVYLDRIRANGQHLLALIDQVLDLARMEAGEMEVELTSIDLRDLLRETLDKLQGGARSGVELRLELPEALAPLEADTGKLRQILINIVGNAIKFTERGRITIVVEVDEPTRRPRAIHVTDTGIGIAPERLSAIFAPFEQGETGTTRRFEGTGLGMAISRFLAELLGYRLQVASEPGVGSTFTLQLFHQESMSMSGEIG